MPLNSSQKSAELRNIKLWMEQVVKCSNLKTE